MLLPNVTVASDVNQAGIQGPPATETPACPVCGTTAEGIVVGTKARFGMDVRNICCEACGLVYISPRPNREAMAEYYRSTYREHYKDVGLATANGSVRPGDPGFEAAMDEWHKNQAMRTSQLANTQLGDRVLEIGCRHGRTLLMLRELFGIEPYGIEPGENEALQAAENGIPCFNGVFEDYDPDELRFDQIQMFHVLEHVHDPLAVLVRMRELLTPTGRVVIEVPNVYQPYGFFEENFLQNVHLTSFSKNTLAVLFRRAGLSIDRIVDASFLLMVGRRDHSVQDAPLPFDPSLLPDPTQDARFVAERLENYALLEKLRAMTKQLGPNLQVIQHLIAAVQKPAFVDHMVSVIAEAVEQLAGVGALDIAHRLASAAANGPHPEEIRGALARLAEECAPLDMPAVAAL